jgi:hypothetical protein
MSTVTGVVTLAAATDSFMQAAKVMRADQSSAACRRPLDAMLAAALVDQTGNTPRFDPQ